MENKCELMWDRLLEKSPSMHLAPWSKQPRHIQDSFIESLNHYSNTKDYTMAYMVMQNASKGE